RRMSPVASDVMLLKGENLIDAVVAATEEFDLMLMSSYARKSWRNQFFKSEQDRIASASLCSVLMIKTPQERLNPVFDPERFRLFSHIEEAAIGVQISASSKDELFEVCAAQFSAACKDYPADSILEAMQIREEAQNTGVGNGVAMPHGTLPQLDRTHLLVATLDSEVDYGAADGIGVKVVFATISPPDDRATVRYLNTALARLSVQTSFLEKLNNAGNSKDIVAALHESLQE
ncbi:MAG: PTS sugar transporter subunit IIA, partial [Myxococcota bacterium]|nr:PTS sugar transporter subunit IIA [Myxococcota bacterium]